MQSPENLDRGSIQLQVVDQGSTEANNSDKVKEEKVVKGRG
jgi:hypothetical protein